MSSSVWVIAALGVSIMGCRFHRDTNAPGIVDVREPPASGAPRQAPEDPGERMVAVNPGLLAGGGAKSKRPRGFGEFGAEVSVNLGESPRSHNGDAFFVYPIAGFGATLGWSALRLERAPVDAESGTPGENQWSTGPVYAEAHVHQLPWGAGGGWAVSPTDGDHGPQAFAYLSGLYMRARHLFDAGTEVTVGWQLKWPLVWIWSR